MQKRTKEAQLYRDSFFKCEKAFAESELSEYPRRGHLTTMQIIESSEYGGLKFPNLAVGYCSRCGCIASQITVEGTFYHAWINPENYEILKIRPIELSNYWKELDSYMYEIDDKRCLVYVSRDASGNPQMRYLVDSGGENMTEHIIIFPKDVKLFQYVEET